VRWPVSAGVPDVICIMLAPLRSAAECSRIAPADPCRGTSLRWWPAGKARAELPGTARQSTSVPSRRSCLCCTGLPDLFRLARVVAARSCRDLETSWSDPVPEAVQGRDRENPLARRRRPCSADHRGNALVTAIAYRRPRAHRYGQPPSVGCLPCADVEDVEGDFLIGP
jgi:hypothetical protein